MIIIHVHSKEKGISVSYKSREQNPTCECPSKLEPSFCGDEDSQL